MEENKIDSDLEDKGVVCRELLELLDDKEDKIKSSFRSMKGQIQKADTMAREEAILTRHHEDIMVQLFKDLPYYQACELIEGAKHTLSQISDQPVPRGVEGNQHSDSDVTLTVKGPTTVKLSITKNKKR